MVHLSAFRETVPCHPHAKTLINGDSTIWDFALRVLVIQWRETWRASHWALNLPPRKRNFLFHFTGQSKWYGCIRPPVAREVPLPPGAWEEREQHRCGLQSLPVRKARTREAFRNAEGGFWSPELFSLQTSKLRTCTQGTPAWGKSSKEWES